MTVCTAFWLVRHAPVAGPPGVIHGPHAPADVSGHGRLAALALALPTTARGYCSPATRTRQTAAALGLDCETVPALGEQDFGDWFGRRHNEIARETGDVYRRFWTSPASNAPPNGESFAEQIERTRSAIREIRDDDAVLVVHSGTIRAALAIALDLAPERALAFVIEPLSLTRMERIGGDWRVTGVNLTR